MRDLILAVLCSTTLAAVPAFAAPDEDAARQAAMAERFKPFDAMTGSDWAAAFASPFYRSAAQGESDSVSLVLKPGSYTVVVLCNCEKIDMAMKAPDGSVPAPARSNDQGAMYRLDVAKGGEYEVSTTLRDCQEVSCSFAVKAYVKK